MQVGGTLIITYTEEEETCEGGGTGVKATCNHSWKEICEALANDTPVYLKEIHQESGQVRVMLEPIIGAVTDNSTKYVAYTITNRINLSFPNATDKWWYSKPCK